MSQLIRFKYWLLDRDEILIAQIDAEDNKPHADFDEVPHKLIVTLKSGKSFSLVCESYYSAKKELDYLTANTEALSVRRDIDHYMVRQLYFCRNSVAALEESVRKLMKSYKKAKKEKN